MSEDVITKFESCLGYPIDPDDASKLKNWGNWTQSEKGNDVLHFGEIFEWLRDYQDND
jgi:hypothetical protein